MPPVIAAVAAALTYIGVGATTAAIVAEIVVGIVVSSTLSAVSTLILKPKGSGFGHGGQTLSFRASNTAAQIVYGQTRSGGAICYLATSTEEGTGDGRNQLLNEIIVIAGHECDEITDIYFNDEIVEFDYSDNDRRDQHGGPGDNIGNAVGTNSTDPGGGLADLAYLNKHLGRLDDPVDPRLLHQFPGVITESDAFKTLAYLHAQLEFDASHFPQGPPNISCLVKGRRVYDPREPSHDPDDPSTWEWSDNWALCVLDYLRGVPFDTGGGVIRRDIMGVGAPDDAIDMDSFIEAANIADESVSVFGGGAQKRYTCNGVLPTDLAPAEALRALLSAGAGKLAWSGGQWKLFAGSYRTPTVSLGDDDQCGPARTVARRARRDLFNGVKGQFRGPSTDYQAVDFPSVTNATYKAQDGDEEIFQTIELPFTDNASACQRIAKIELERNRQQITTERTFKLSALGTQVGDVILLTDSRKGWSEKPFEIGRWTLVTESDAQGQPYLAIQMALIETASSIYDWDPGEETEFDTAPDTNLPRPWEVVLAGAPGIFEELYSTRDGSGVKTRVTVSWSPSTDAFLLDYTLEYKLSSEEVWTKASPTADTKLVLNDVNAGIYDFRVRPRNTVGVFGAYSTSSGLTVYGLGAVPATLTNLGIQPLGNQAMLAWTQSSDLDVREGGKIEFRHSPATSGATWETSTQIREAVNGTQTYATVPLKAGTYLIRPVDSSGIPGDFTEVLTKQASINGFAALSGSPLTEETGFTGTHSGTTEDGGVLKLTNVGLWDDIADLDAELGNIDDLGGLTDSGTYTFDNAFDFGAVVNARLTSLLDVEVTSIGSNFDDRTGMIDDWDDFDGSLSGAAADAWVEYRQTDDDPSGSPTWTEWMRLDTAEVECRAVECRAQLRSYDPNYNIELATLQVAAEELV